MTNKLRTLLDERNLTRYWLAKQLDIKPPFIYRICDNNDKANIPPEMELKIKELLGLDSTDELY